jgi:ketosteroid isomerase-like protein
MPRIHLRQVCAATAVAMTALTTSASASAANSFSAADLAAEEAKFAAYSVQHGMRDAFVEFFATDSILLRPDPVNGREFMKARQNPPIRLDWKSQLAILSASGDLGLSTGPWTSTSNTDPAAPNSHGQFFSVWQKQVDGSWKVLIDHGISHGNNAAPDRPLRALDLAKVKSKLAKTPASDPEKEFALATSARGAADAYLAAISEQTRLLRDERAPIDGRRAIDAYLKSVPGSWQWQPLKQGESAAGDFAYTLGTWSHRTPAGINTQGHYIRVWVRDLAAQPGRWQLGAEVLTIRPPSKS